MEGESYVDDVDLRDAETLWLRVLSRQRKSQEREQGDE